jgi:hypothetical protein
MELLFCRKVSVIQVQHVLSGREWRISCLDPVLVTYGSKFYMLGAVSLVKNFFLLYSCLLYALPFIQNGIQI